jgi:hypothetical protein
MPRKRAHRRRAISNRIAQLERNVRDLHARVLEFERMVSLSSPPPQLTNSNNLADRIALGLSLSRKVGGTEYSLVPSADDLS